MSPYYGIRILPSASLMIIPNYLMMQRAAARPPRPLGVQRQSTISVKIGAADRLEPKRLRLLARIAESVGDPGMQDAAELNLNLCVCGRARGPSWRSRAARRQVPAPA
jgi:hypothetical protein